MSSELKDDTEYPRLILLGMLFHRRGAPTAKAQPPLDLSQRWNVAPPEDINLQAF